MRRTVKLTLSALMLALAAVAASSCSDTQASAATGKENSSVDYLDQVTAQKNHSLNMTLKREFSASENE
ncbi:MAG: hypothetical protein MJZ66_00370 [Bacteroidales bacterium]|nr:hypothetical protein [Bacteroidales bacterium]